MEAARVDLRLGVAACAPDRADAPVHDGDVGFDPAHLCQNRAVPHDELMAQAGLPGCRLDPTLSTAAGGRVNRFERASARDGRPRPGPAIGRPGNLRYQGGMAVHPVILSGGAGTRLWPLSRARFPEAAHAAPLRAQPAAGDRAAARREAWLRPAGHRLQRRASVPGRRAAARDRRRAAAILVEPVGRNTAPAVAAAALAIAAKRPRRASS